MIFVGDINVTFSNEEHLAQIPVIKEIFKGTIISFNDEHHSKSYGPIVSTDVGMICFLFV